MVTTIGSVKETKVGHAVIPFFFFFFFFSLSVIGKDSHDLCTVCCGQQCSIELRCAYGIDCSTVQWEKVH